MHQRLRPSRASGSRGSVAPHCRTAGRLTIATHRLRRSGHELSRTACRSAVRNVAPRCSSWVRVPRVRDCRAVAVPASSAWGDGSVPGGWSDLRDLPRARATSVSAHGNSLAMSNDLVDIFLLSLLSMFNPTLLAAVTVMMLLPSPKRLMAGYLLGAYTTSITLGLVIVFALPGSSTESTSKHTIGPLEDIAVGAARGVDRVRAWNGS